MSLIRMQEVPLAEVDCVRGWDFASSEAIKPGDDPDWTAGVLLAVGRRGDWRGRWIVVNARRCRKTPRDTEKFLMETTGLDDARMERRVPIRVEKEGGSAGAWTIDQLARGVMLGRDFDGITPKGSKAERAKEFSIAAQNGYVDIVEGHWNEEYLEELELFPTPGVHDDQVDATSLGFHFLRPDDTDLEFVTLAQSNAWDIA